MRHLIAQNTIFCLLWEHYIILWRVTHVQHIPAGTRNVDISTQHSSRPTSNNTGNLHSVVKWTYFDMHYMQLGIKNIPSSSSYLPSLTLTHFFMFLLQHNQWTQYVQYLHLLQKIKCWSIGPCSILKTWKFVIIATWILLPLWCFLGFYWLLQYLHFGCCILTSRVCVSAVLCFKLRM